MEFDKSARGASPRVVESRHVLTLTTTFQTQTMFRASVLLLMAVRHKLDSGTVGQYPWSVSVDRNGVLPVRWVLLFCRSI